MVALQMETLQTDVLSAEQRLHDVEKIYGKQSSEYNSALSRFAKIWFVMRMSRRPDEFLPEQTQMLS